MDFNFGFFILIALGLCVTSNGFFSSLTSHGITAIDMPIGKTRVNLNRVYGFDTILGCFGIKYQIDISKVSKGNVSVAMTKVPFTLEGLNKMGI